MDPKFSLKYLKGTLETDMTEPDTTTGHLYFPAYTQCTPGTHICGDHLIYMCKTVQLTLLLFTVWKNVALLVFCIDVFLINQLLSQLDPIGSNRLFCLED